MSRLDIYKKQAKQLVGWHRERHYSIGGRIRGLARYKTPTDREALALEFPLREAQEIIALEAGYASWAALKVAVTNEPTPAKTLPPTPRLTRAVPVIFVVNVQASAEFFRDTLGFSIDFLHGHPAFYGSVSRDGACVHLNRRERRGLSVFGWSFRRHRRACSSQGIPSESFVVSRHSASHVLLDLIADGYARNAVATDYTIRLLDGRVRRRIS